MLKRLLAPLLLSVGLFFVGSGCTPGQQLGLRTANTIMAGVACGIAAANETPCTPTEALSAFMSAQKEVVTILASQASKGTDPAILEALMKGLEASAATQRVLAEQVLALAEKANAAPPVPTPIPLVPSSPPVHDPPASPPPASVPPSGSADPAPSAPAPAPVATAS